MGDIASEAESTGQSQEAGASTSVSRVEEDQTHHTQHVTSKPRVSEKRGREEPGKFDSANS